MNEIIMNPSTDDVRRAGAQFDSDSNNKILEEALQELFGQFPQNTHLAQVLLKVTALNTLYSTQIPLYHETIPTIFEVAEHIVNLGIDSDLRRGVDGLVRSLATVEVPPKKVRFNYSFATKYCSWHNPEAYPIFDSRVYAYLCHLVNHGCIDRFIRNDMWDYPIFKRTIEGFKERNLLGEFTFKEIDKFLYLQGAIVIRGREKTTTEPSETGTLETEPIFMPVPPTAWRNGGTCLIKEDGETILEVGTEGGAITLLGKRTAAGPWEFWTQTDETTFRDTFDEEQLPGPLVHEGEIATTLAEAFALLSRYQWHTMTPLKVHPDFRDAILDEVQRRGKPEEVETWTFRGSCI